MLKSRIIMTTALLSISIWGTSLRAQVPAEEIGPLPTKLSQQKAAALTSLLPVLSSTQTSPRRLRRYFFRLYPPLTPGDVALRESVRSLGTDNHRFVRCELKDQSVITGPITSIGDERFFVQTEIMGNGRSISYRELSAEPRPVAAVGEHFKNGLEWTGMVLVAIPLLPFAFLFWDGC